MYIRMYTYIHTYIHTYHSGIDIAQEYETSLSAANFFTCVTHALGIIYIYIYIIYNLYIKKLFIYF